MSLEGLNGVLLGAPPVASAGILAVSAWLRQKRKEKTEEKMNLEQQAIEKALAMPMPGGSLEMNWDGVGDTVPTEVLGGKIMLVLAGTFGHRQGSRILKALDACGLSEAIGSIVLIEPDKGQKGKFLNEMPPVFRDRLVMVTCASVSGGWANRSPEWLKDMRPRWVPEVRRRATDVCNLHQRRGLEVYGRSDDAALVLVVISEGTSSWMGLEAVPVMLGRFKGAQCIGMTAHPVDDLLRGRAPLLLQKYYEAGCQGIYVEDNAPDEECPDRDPLANDVGLTTLVVGPISAAASTRDAASESNNMNTLVFGLDDEESYSRANGKSPNGGQKNGLRLASFRICTSSIPGKVFQPHPALRPRPYVIDDSMTSATITALEEVENPERRAVSARFGRPKTSRFDIVMTPLEPRSLEHLEDRVTEALSTASNPRPKRNYHLVFAGMKMAIDMDQPSCPIIAVSVEALADPGAHLARVATPYQPKRPQLGAGNVTPALEKHNKEAKGGKSREVANN